MAFAAPQGINLKLLLSLNNVIPIVSSFDYDISELPASRCRWHQPARKRRTGDVGVGQQSIAVKDILYVSWNQKKTYYKNGRRFIFYMFVTWYLQQLVTDFNDWRWYIENDLEVVLYNFFPESSLLIPCNLKNVIISCRQDLPSIFLLFFIRNSKECRWPVSFRKFLQFEVGFFDITSLLALDQ